MIKENEVSFREITISLGGNSFDISPERGGIVTGLSVGGKSVLYLDRASFLDGTKNVRGGIPILFPYAGKLDGEIFVAAGTKMKQHGFGRNSVWTKVSEGPGTLTIRLSSSDETRAVYPYEFCAEQTCTLLPRGLLVELSIVNRSTKPMPVSPGWHPYFNCAADKKATVRGNVQGLGADSFGDDREFDFGLLPPADGKTAFDVPALGKLEIGFSPEMRHMQFWSQPGKPFICLEPFFGPNNTVNTAARCDIAPGAGRSFYMKLELDPRG